MPTRSSPKSTWLYVIVAPVALVTVAVLLFGCQPQPDVTVTVEPTAVEPTKVQPIEVEPTATGAEPTATVPAPEATATPEPLADTSGQYDFEDGTTQGWAPRGEASVSVVADVAHSGSHSLLASDRTDGWNGAIVDVLGLLEPGNTYEVGAYARLAEGEPDSRVILTMQRTPVDGDTVYEWIAPSAEGGVTDGEWVYLKGQYAYRAEAAELSLYVESPDHAFRRVSTGMGSRTHWRPSVHG